MNRNSVKYISLGNAVYILFLGVYGFIIDEAYWHDVSHSPTIFDSLNWIAIILNLPSYLLIKEPIIHWGPGYVTDGLFELMYVVWPLLAFVQWRIYFHSPKWIHNHNRILFVLPVLGIMSLIVSIISIVWVWPLIHNEICLQWGLLEIPAKIMGVGSAAVIVWAISKKSQKI